MSDLLENASIVPVDLVANTILVLRGQRVIMDADLARLYGVTTKRLNEQVKRNRDRFPSDFIFQLKEEEKSELVANCDRFKNLRHSTVCPYAFTEHGTVMAATILSTPRAAEVSVYVVRAFIHLRELLATRTEVAYKLEELERRLDGHDDKIELILEAVQALMALPEPSGRRIGFRIEDDD